MNPAFSEQMIFFSFDVINDEDAGLLYLKPDDLDMSNQETILYTRFTSVPQLFQHLVDMIILKS